MVVRRYSIFPAYENVWLWSALRTGAPQDSEELSEHFLNFPEVRRSWSRVSKTMSWCTSSEIDSVIGNKAIGPERIQPRVILCAVGSCAEPFRTSSKVERACRIDRHRLWCRLDPNLWGHNRQVRVLRRVSNCTRYWIDSINISLMIKI